ncbi:hypothetical protein [Burkholderia multivorans]|uniref:hypothetical protein n=1 Tax=Burkholderia multivorans TaxID=87883 RepID=UPI0013DF3803|nr:hypothetical protein [Burkholderia multivorans]MCO1374638.1 hypothetical protein [Burkholderia multivorans]MCO1382811.1 hypothetical protein [Burkholderia multivorans]MCO1403203.1 hypothetical protein [Burkholderia multivorans]MCO1459781.1 hypothetical protein [Burkholderia multivorans]NGM78769.1 hypothetical protein [Burkholderia multivorans]
MIRSADEASQLAHKTSDDVPSEGEIIEDLARRLKVLKSGEHRLSQYGQPLTSLYAEAVVWIVVAAILWVASINFLA